MDNPEQRIRGILRRSLVVAKWTSGILVALGLLFVGINWFDEELSPEAKALLTPPSNPYKPEENLYLALLGFDAKEGESPIEVGQARVASYEKEIAAALKDPPREYGDFPDSAWQSRKGRLEFKGKADFCQPLTKSCLIGVEGHEGDIHELLPANRELYRRYSRLRELKGYHETATPSLYIVTAYAPRPLRQLYLANIALRTKSGGRNAAIADLLADIRVWRLVLTGNGSLISKMIAVANLQGDYVLLADIIADSNVDLANTSPQIRMALDSPEGDWKIGDFVVFEFRLRAYLWNQMRADTNKQAIWDFSEDWWGRLGNRVSWFFFKLNATQNLDARVTAQMRAVVDAEPGKFFSARDNYRNWTRKNLDFGVRYAYNPMGKFLLAFGTDAYQGYFLRAYDGAAFQRLVRLGYEIRRQRIQDRAIPEFMRQNPQWASHPVDGKLFVWDAKKREIAVQTLGQQPKDRRFSIAVWRRPQPSSSSTTRRQP